LVSYSSTTISTLCEFYICTEILTVFVLSESFSLNVLCLQRDVDVHYVTEFEVLREHFPILIKGAAAQLVEAL